MHRRAQTRDISLYTQGGARKYINLSERTALIAQLGELPADQKLFVLMLVWSGARVSEILQLTESAFQPDRGVVAIRTLKRRRHVVREIPIPPDLMDAIEGEFGIRKRQAEPCEAHQRLWRFTRGTAWQIVRRAMHRAGIQGVRASPRGLRHGFGTGAVGAGVPLDMVQHFLGHASIKTTTIYTEASGPEARALAARFWNFVG